MSELVPGQLLVEDIPDAKAVRRRRYKARYYTAKRTDGLQTDKLILSYGAGWNTFAVLLKLREWGLKPDYAVFADTGNESPLTYEHMQKYQIPLMQQMGLKLATVKNPNWSSLLEYTLAKRKMPFRKKGTARYCTGMFKLEPIIRFEASIRLPKERFTNIIGIAYDEIHRMSKLGRRKWITNIHPLVDRKLTRMDCKRIIEDAGFPLPPKSGCDFCPFQRQSQWAKTARDNPTAIDDGVMIETLFNQKLREKNGPTQKKYLTLRSDNMPLEVWRKERMQTDIAAIEKIEADEALQVLLDETCDMETCMT